MNKFYLSTAIPYVNAKPHVGHALEFVQTDVIKRFHQLNGDNTLLLSGGDENAIKNVQAAENEGISVEKLVDKNSELFADLAKKLNIHFDVFQKGSSKQHYLSSQELWKKCFENGDIYKKTYTGLYCVGCELFYEKEELNENLECFEHPGKKLEEVSEENYFFKLSKYQEQILKLIENDEIKIIPQTRKNEALSFVKQGLKDISISRSNKRAKNWGVPVPEDPTQRMYVWFDALNIYQSGVGFAWDENLYKKWWPCDLHVIGKGILRFHVIYWPAFLLSANLELPKSVFVHGYFTVNGQKMSKTLGNVIDPIDIINKFGTDALRYYLLKEIPPTGDGDFSEERLKTAYNSDLANGLGNLVARVAKLAEKNNIKIDSETVNSRHSGKFCIAERIQNPDSGHLPATGCRLRRLQAGARMTVFEHLEKFQFNLALEAIWQDITKADKKINDTKPWELSPEQAKPILEDLIKRINEIAYNLGPFLPETSKKILDQFKGPKILSQKPMFPRI